MSERRQPLLPVTVTVFVLLMLGLWNNPAGWWVAMCFCIVASAWFFYEARQSWMARKSEVADRLAYTYDSLTSCFAFLGSLALLAAGMMHRARINATPVEIAAAVLFVVFYGVAVPMRIKLESEKRRRRRRAPEGRGSQVP